MLEVQGGYKPLPCFPRASRCLQFHNFSLLLVVIFKLLGLHDENSISEITQTENLIHRSSRFSSQNNNNVIPSNHKLKNFGFLFYFILSKFGRPNIWSLRQYGQSSRHSSIYKERLRQMLTITCLA
jgi:hypothetical protein